MPVVMLWPTKVHNLLEIQSKPRKDLSRLILDTKDVITRKQRNQFQQNEQQTFLTGSANILEHTNITKEHQVLRTSSYHKILGQTFNP